jgi:tetratricopeptide (TPR) repeat protein
MTGGRTTSRLAIVVVAGLVWGIVLAGSARAQDDPAALSAEVQRLLGAGRYADATKIAKRLITVYEKALGPEHLYVATSVYILAELYWRQGRYAEAEPLFKRSLAIREKVPAWAPRRHGAQETSLCCIRLSATTGRPNAKASGRHPR